MYKEAKTILDLLHKRNFEAYYIGGKCRNELHNENHPTAKVEVKDVDIVTNATSSEIKAIFPNSNLRGESFQVVAVNFGGHEFEISTYRKDIYDMNEVKKNKKVTKPQVDIAKELDEDRARRDYTINAIAEDGEGNYFDYVYEYRNKKISSMQDIKDGVIRAIGNARQRFEEDPLRILRAFRFVSQLGYEIEKQTFKTIESNLNLIEKIPHERIQAEMNKIIAGQNASKALILMKDLNVFNLEVFNSIKNKPTVLMPGLNTIENKHFATLDKFNKNNKSDKFTAIELWTILLRPLGVEGARENLESIYPLSLDDIEKVEWLIEHYNLIDSTDIKNDIFKARSGIVLRKKLPCMRELIQMLSEIYITLMGNEYNKKSVDLMNAFCSRPYFQEQLKVTGEQMMEIAGEEPGPWISRAKEKLLYKLINTQRFPKEIEKYMELVSEAVEEAVFEETMSSEGLI